VRDRADRILLDDEIGVEIDIFSLTPCLCYTASGSPQSDMPFGQRTALVSTAVNKASKDF
jgi:hypothetical protein